MLAEATDPVLGHRTSRSMRTFPVSPRLANLALARAVRRQTGMGLRDLGPVRVFRCADLLALDLADRRWGDPLQTVLAAHDASWRWTRGWFVTSRG